LQALEPCGFLYRAAKKSHTAGTLGEIGAKTGRKIKNYKKLGKKSYTLLKKRRSHATLVVASGNILSPRRKD
jgi:hypothetical protein